MSDQLKRSSLSIALNIAEASGRATPRDKRKHFAIARGSALESFAALDACRILKLIEMSSFNSAKVPLEEIIAMLSSLSLDNGKGLE